MARNTRRDKPVSESEFEGMAERIAQHFDRVRNLLDAELDDDK